MTADQQPRIGVAKTHKLFIGGAFPRSESGRTYPVTAEDGSFLANVALASRKDARDAVSAARSAFPSWAGRSAYNRGQILYRIAEVLESRRHDVAQRVAEGEGCSQAQGHTEVDAAVDRIVWYAGWTDKLAQVFGNANPVAGPYFNVSTPEPVGVAAVIAPQESSLLGLVSVILPPLAAGNTVVAVSSELRPLPAVAFMEALATSDVPAGVVNILTGATAELAGPLASHGDVGVLDLTGVAPNSRAPLVEAASATTTRVIDLTRRREGSSTAPTDAWHTPPTTARMRGALDLKTVWHPAGT